MRAGPLGRHGISSRFRDLPLFLKLLVPFVALMLLLGGLGGYLIVRDLSSRAQAALERDLSRRALEVRSLFRDRELSLLESTDFAANLEGMAEALRDERRADVAELLRSVLAVKARIGLVVIADREGTGVAEFLRRAGADRPIHGAGTDWSRASFVREALGDRSGAKGAGLLGPRFGGRSIMVSIAGAVCSAVRPCSSVGVAITGIDVEVIADEAVVKLRSVAPGPVGVAIFDRAGTAIATEGLAAAPVPRLNELGSGMVRATHVVGSEEIATVFAPVELQGVRQGTIAVSVPTAGAFSSVRGAGVRLALILLAGLAGIVAIGVLLSRFILAQVRPLVATNRALGTGDLSARAPVLGNDELGELAAGVNQMAEQLGASVETLELRVQQRTAEVRRLLRERTEFFTALSHEFRTPLAVILRQADLLIDARTPKTSRWTSQSGRTLKESGQQLLFLINDILHLAQAEVGGLEVSLEQVRLADVVKDARRTIDGLAKGSGLALSISVPADLPPVRADRARLREIILNLVDNAVKYTPAGGRVELSAGARDGHVVVSVADTGVGIPPEAQARIFEPFYRAKGIKTQQGQASSGLGLALTKRLVEAHGGEIRFESEPGAGTTVTFTLTRA